jgi:hypothetical protein
MTNDRFGTRNTQSTQKTFPTPRPTKAARCCREAAEATTYGTTEDIFKQKVAKLAKEEREMHVEVPDEASSTF